MDYSLIFKKLDNGNYAAPDSKEEITVDAVIDAIKEWNGLNTSRSMYFKEGGDVYLTDCPSIALYGVGTVFDENGNRVNIDSRV